MLFSAAFVKIFIKERRGAFHDFCARLLGETPRTPVFPFLCLKMPPFRDEAQNHCIKCVVAWINAVLVSLVHQVVLNLVADLFLFLSRNGRGSDVGFWAFPKQGIESEFQTKLRGLSACEREDTFLAFLMIERPAEMKSNDRLCQAGNPSSLRQRSISFH